MVVMMKLKYVDELSGGRKRFRRRFPKAVAGVLGEEFFQVPIKAREGVALVKEQETLLAEYEKIVAKAKRKGAGQGTLTGNRASLVIGHHEAGPRKVDDDLSRRWAAE
ncbi:hypothetical protein MB818_07950 [Ruegeria sp. 1NDH52C]|uniref:Transposase n=1 Tax=Ruegeria alba TaxID=2916756 RepID=A0ABS9NV82_9RHOB|nr:hypothetical protein [Ruegeria alba]MCG6558128.1 hypothetical protein [Ruegeria alba]